MSTCLSSYFAYVYHHRSKNPLLSSAIVPGNISWSIWQLLKQPRQNGEEFFLFYFLSTPPKIGELRASRYPNILGRSDNEGPRFDVSPLIWSWLSQRRSVRSSAMIFCYIQECNYGLIRLNHEPWSGIIRIKFVLYFLRGSWFVLVPMLLLSLFSDADSRTNFAI